MKTLKRSLLSTAVLAASIAPAYAATYTPQKIGDLEIYQAATGGSVTIAMMIDLSGSMQSPDLSNERHTGYAPGGIYKCFYDAVNPRYPGVINTWNPGSPSRHKLNIPITKADGTVDSNVELEVIACPDRRNGRVNFVGDAKDLRVSGGGMTRLSRLKLGLIGLLADGTALSEDHRIAMGYFPVPKASKRAGSMQFPAKKLTLEHRKDLIHYIKYLEASGGTPIAHAYPEVASYMMGSTTNTPAIQSLYGPSPTGFDESSRETKSGGKYKSPLDTSTQCEGYGIYFLTDGEPNLSSNNLASRVMGQSLGIATLDRRGITPLLSDQNAAYQDQSAWESIGVYSQALRKQKQFGKEGLRTATVGFGSVFNGFVTKTTQVLGNDGKIKTVTIPDCDSPRVRGVDARNLCKLGSLEHEFGKGGFTATGNPKELADSITHFISNLKQSISASPSGTISIPSDPLSASNIQPYAYLPMIQPQISSSPATWEGNLKKYHTINGTLYGKDKTTRLYIKSVGATAENKDFPSRLNKDAMDLWQVTPEADNSSVTAGGTLSRLPHPKKRSARTVYVETKDRNNKDTMISVSIDINKQLKNFDQLDARYTISDMAYLVNYLGYDVPTNENSYRGPDRNAKLRELQTKLRIAPMTAGSYIGGVLHSVPVLATYGGEFDTNTGDISSDEAKRDDHLIYGSMEGALHMVKAKEGEEVFAFIPRVMFDNDTQKRALKAGETSPTVEMSPRFGVDAPWSVRTEYTYTNNRMNAEKMFTYGGLRMGGAGFYGLDITNKDTPKLSFSINANTSGFERLGQTWAKPLVARIQTGNGLDSIKDVLIFGGGYDMCYENPKFKLVANAATPDANNADTTCNAKTEAQGNAVYMIDADTGELLQKWTSNNNANMKHSIVSEIVGRDRNNDGLVDHLYFGDLGGQLFRIDLKSGIVPDGRDNITRRIVRLFDANKNIIDADHISYRFYEKPAVSIHKVDNGRVAVINISSGDRSSPVHPYRKLEDANRIYGIIDRDVATFRASRDDDNRNPLKTKDLGNDDLLFYDTNGATGVGQDAIDTVRKGYIDQLKAGTKQGWYYKMTRFDAYEKVKNLKSVGSSITIGSIYHASIYNPEYDYTQGADCSAKISGGTERQMFCLPWGICANPTTGTLTKRNNQIIAKNGTLGYTKAGPGIQELAISTLTGEAGKSTRYSTLISQQTLDESNHAAANPIPPVNDATKTGENKDKHTTTGGNPLANRGVSREYFTMKINRWYDLADAEKQ